MSRRLQPVTSREPTPAATLDGQLRSLKAAHQKAKTLHEMAQLLQTAITVAEAFRYQASRDGLTNLYNRRYLEESLHRELRRAARKRSPLGVMMIDLDHFKQFNDQEGHEGGDFFLRNFATVIASQVRAEDTVCRYGGDEFSVILPDTGTRSLIQRAEQLGESIRGVTMIWKGRTVTDVTASIGVAVFPDHGSTAEGLLEAADAALYSAKANGRNCVKTAVSRTFGKTLPEVLRTRKAN